MKGYVVYTMCENYDVNILTGEKTNGEAKKAKYLGVYETLGETITYINQYIKNVGEIDLNCTTSKTINMNDSMLSTVKEEDNDILKDGVCVVCYDNVYEPVLLMQMGVYHNEIYIKYLDFETE